MRATRHTPALLIGVELLVALNALAGGVIIPISWLQPAFLALGALVGVPGLQLRRID
jgi:hypothetical protein